MKECVEVTGTNGGLAMVGDGLMEVGHVELPPALKRLLPFPSNNTWAEEAVEEEGKKTWLKC